MTQTSGSQLFIHFLQNLNVSHFLGLGQMMTMMGLVATIILLLTLKTAVGLPFQLYGLNYNTRQGPDWEPDTEKCKSREQVVVDLTLLKRLTNRIRLLSLVDCGQGELVLDVAKELGMQIWLGLWVSAFENIFLDELAIFENMLARGLIDDSVLGITVGSESIYRKEVTVAQIIGYRAQVKDMLVAAGKSDLPVSIVDIAPLYTAKPELISAVDIVVTNSFPFWESIDIDEATNYLVEKINPIISQAAAQNKQVMLGETGWPSAGYNPGVGAGSPEAQTEFFTQFFCRMDIELNWPYFYFTGIDNAWRTEQDPNNTIEEHWGFFYANLTAKPHFQDLVFTCPGSSDEYRFSEVYDGQNVPVPTDLTITPAPSVTQETAPPSQAPTVAPNESVVTQAPTVPSTAPPSTTALPGGGTTWTASPTSKPTNIDAQQEGQLPDFTFTYVTSDGAVARRFVTLALILCSLLVLC